MVMSLVYDSIRPFPTGLEGFERVCTCILFHGCMDELDVGFLQERDLWSYIQIMGINYILFLYCQEIDSVRCIMFAL